MSPGMTMSAKHLALRNYTTNNVMGSMRDGSIENTIPVIVAHFTGFGRLWL
jgi:hypothetical protein